jgi:hypothetical protein
MLTLGTAACILALPVTRPWPSSHTRWAPWLDGEYVRIELRPVQFVESGQATDGEAAAKLRKAGNENEFEVPPERAPGFEPAAGPIEPMPAVEQGPSVQGRRPTVLDGLLPVSFNLSDPDEPDRSSIQVRKNVRFNGMDAGPATILIGGGSALSISREDLRMLLSAARRADLVETLATGENQPFVRFDEVRRAGLNLRYDAAADRILISG